MKRSLRLCTPAFALLLGLPGCGGPDRQPPGKGAPDQPTESHCSDGKDDDGDGHADCDDLDCRVAGGSCELAPPLDRTVATTVDAAAKFLYTGADPLQKDADKKAFDARRVAILRGKVVDLAGKPLAGVKLSVVGHDEYGYTLSRPDGVFDLALNGGGRVVLKYEREGYLGAQRSSTPGWQRYGHLPEVGLVERSPNASPVRLEGDAQVALGDAVDDDFGSHQPLVFFAANTSATAELGGGKKQALGSLTLGITEYPFEPNSAKGFASTARFAPGTLPITGALHYGLEFHVAEAEALGARRVNLSAPAVVYLENFLRLPVGSPVPLGYYDEKAAQWQGASGGKVVRLLAIEAGKAVLDLDGDGQKADDAALAKAGITGAELRALADRYEVDDALWRATVTHFSSWDMLFPVGTGAGATAPYVRDPFSRPLDVPSRRGGSVVERRASSHAVPLTGTPYSLHYQSDRTRDFASRFELDFPLVPEAVPSGLKSVISTVEIAGQELTLVQEPTPGLRRKFVWNGKDAFGREMQGPQTARVRVGYAFDAVLEIADGFGVVSAPNGLDDAVDAGDAVLVQEYERSLGVWDALGYELGGLSLDVQHAYSPNTETLFFGWGDERTAQNVALVVTQPGKAFDLGTPDSIGVSPDGSLFVTDDQQDIGGGLGRILRVDREGNATVVAGDGANGEAGELVLDSPQGIAVKDDGTILVSDLQNDAVREVRPDGTVRTLLGPATDEPLVEGTLSNVDGIALGPREELYVVDRETVLRVEGGVAKVFAGGATEDDGVQGDGGPATEALLVAPSAVVAAADGSVFISERGSDEADGGHRVRKVSPSGVISTVAGTGVPGFTGDGGDGRQAKLNGPRGLALAQDGSLYIADQENDRIRRVTPDGVIQTVVGGGDAELAEGQLAEKVALDRPDGIAVDRDGLLYIAAGESVFRVAPGMPKLSSQEALIPSTDGRTLFRFDPTGRHQETLNAMTGVTELTFTYDDDGRLSSLRDKNGLTTTIERKKDGTPVAIAAPFGQRTLLELDDTGTVRTLKDPLARETTFVYADGGTLLTKLVEPGGREHDFTYGELGLLESVKDPRGYLETFAPGTSDAPLSVLVTTTPKTRSLEYSADLAGDTLKRKVRLPDGNVIEWNDTLASTSRKDPDGSTTTTRFLPDDAFGAQALFPSEITVKTPSGKTLSALGTRGKRLTDIDNRLSVEEWTEQYEVNGRTFEELYIAKDRTRTSISPEGRRRTSKLDELGRTTEVTSAGLPTVRLEYDDRGRILTITRSADGQERREERTYGDDGFLVATTNAALDTHGYEHDLAGRVTALLRPDDGRVELELDDANNLLSLTPPGREPHRFSYDSGTNRVRASVPPAVAGASGKSELAVGETRYEYTADEDVAAVRRSDGRSVEYDYDEANGRLKSVSLSATTIGFGYDAGGELTSVSRTGGAKVTLTHDGPLWTGTTWSGQIEGKVSASYDDDFHLSALTVNDASTAKFSYDRDGLVTSATANKTTLELTRDAATGFVTSSTLGTVSTTQKFSGFGELSELSARFQDTTGFEQRLERDELGRVTKVSERFGTKATEIEYGYDELGRLTRAARDGEETRYDYDANGNRVRVAGSADFDAEYDAQDRLVRYGGIDAEQTQQGELLRLSDGETALELAYDELGQLENATLSDDASSYSIDYVMDGLGRRVARQVNGVFDKAWLYADALRPVAEIDADGTFMHFIYTSDDSAPDFVLRAGVPLRVVKDHLGSVRLVVNAQSGVVEQRLDYDEFGVVLEDSRPGFQPFGFAGGLYDPDTHLVRFGARDYDADAGRWLAKDPLGFSAGDPNLYAYCGSDPVNCTDPNGLDPTSQECVDLAKKIENVQKEIDKRTGELKEDKLNLPETAPGDDKNPSLSKAGHRALLNMHKANLAALKAKYLTRCGPPPGGEPPLGERIFDKKFWERTTGLTGWALVFYLIVSEGSRAIPVRNLVPVP